MPNNWSLVDTSFPTFTGEEPVKEQIAKIMDYMAILTEMLQYQLENLDESNWNDKALQDLTDDATTELALQVKQLGNQVSALRSTVDSIVGRISTAENLAGRMVAAEEAITYLEKDKDEKDQRLSNLEEAVEEVQLKSAENGQVIADLEDAVADAKVDIGAIEQELYEEGGLLERMQEAEDGIQKLTGAVQVAEDGSVTVGAEGKPLHLKGEIYINGVLYQGGTE